MGCVRTAADVEQFGVAEIAFGRPVLGVARPAQHLDRLIATRTAFALATNVARNAVSLSFSSQP